MADITAPPGRIDPEGSSADTESSLDVTQALHGFTVPQVIYETVGGVWTLAKADVVSTANALGVVTAVAGANNFTVTFAGLKDVFTGLTVGSMHYLSNTLAGGLTTDEPAISRGIVNASSATEGFIFTEAIHGDASHFALPYIVGPAGGDNIYQYNNIQDAIDAAETENIPTAIYIMPGTYTEDVTITTLDGLSLIGSGRASTIINGPFAVENQNIKKDMFVSGLQVTHSTIINNATGAAMQFNDCLLTNTLGSGNDPFGMEDSSGVARLEVVMTDCQIIDTENNFATFLGDANNLDIDFINCSIVGVCGAGDLTGAVVAYRDCDITSLTVPFDLPDASIDLTIENTSITKTSGTNGEVFNLTSFTGTLTMIGGSLNGVSNPVVNPDPGPGFFFSNIATSGGAVLDTSMGTRLDSDGVALESDGSADEYLDNSGSYSAPPGVAAGDANQVQYNDGSDGFAANAAFIFDATNRQITLGISGNSGTTAGRVVVHRAATSPTTFPSATAAVHLLGGASTRADLTMEDVSDGATNKPTIVMRRARDAGDNVVLENDDLADIGSQAWNGSMYRLVTLIRSTVTAPLTGSDPNFNIPGSLRFFVTPSGTTIQEKMRLQHDGKLGIGTTSPDKTLHVRRGDSGVTPDTNAVAFFEHSGTATVILGAPDANSSGFFIETPSNARAAGILYNALGGSFDLRLLVHNAVGLTITTALNVGIGTTAPLSTLELGGSLGVSSNAGNGVVLNSFNEVAIVRIARETADAATVAAGGTGYAVNDVIEMTGGSPPSATQGQFTVATISGSAVATVTQSADSAYSVQPTNPVTMTTITGGGSGCTLNITSYSDSPVEFPSTIRILTVDMVEGRVFWVQDESGVASVANPITVEGESGTINGDTDIEITVPYGGFWVRVRGGNLFAVT